METGEILSALAGAFAASFLLPLLIGVPWYLERREKRETRAAEAARQPASVAPTQAEEHHRPAA